MEVNASYFFCRSGTKWCARARASRPEPTETLPRMRCDLACLLASALVVASFSCSFPVNRKITEKLRALLTNEQTAILDDIVAERSRIALEGLVLGLLVAMPVATALGARCAATAVLLITQGAYYHLAPKSKWMLNHVETREQVDAWLEVYKSMKLTGTASAVGAAAVYLLAWLLLKGST